MVICVLIFLYFTRVMIRDGIFSYNFIMVQFDANLIKLTDEIIFYQNIFYDTVDIVLGLGFLYMTWKAGIAKINSRSNLTN